jgi:NitT/TauT family transport system permease protein
MNFMKNSKLMTKQFWYEIFKNLLKTFSIITLVVLSIIAIWYILYHWFDKPYLVASPFDTFELIYSQSIVLEYLMYTIFESLIGLIMALSLGSVIAILLHSNSIVKKIFTPYGIILQATPIIALAPIVKHILSNMIDPFTNGMIEVYFFSINTLFAFMVSIYPIIYNFLEGLEKTPLNKIEWASVSGASKPKIFLYIRLPFALPKLLDGLITALPLSVVGAVVSEMIVAPFGIGKMIDLGNKNTDPTMVFSAIVLLALAATTLYIFFNFISVRIKDLIYGETMH